MEIVKIVVTVSEVHGQALVEAAARQGWSALGWDFQQWPDGRLALADFPYWEKGEVGTVVQTIGDPATFANMLAGWLSAIPAKVEILR